jgi:hypothetical protein
VLIEDVSSTRQSLCTFEKEHRTLRIKGKGTQGIKVSTFLGEKLAETDVFVEEQNWVDSPVATAKQAYGSNVKLKPRPNLSIGMMEASEADRSSLFDIDSSGQHENDVDT